MPHELVPHFRNGVPIEVLHHSPHDPGLELEARSNPQFESTSNRVHSRASSIHELLNPSSSLESNRPASASSTQEWANPSTSPLSSFETPADHSYSMSTDITSQTTLKQDSQTSSSRKRDHAEMTGPSSLSVNDAAHPPPKLTSMSPMVRLSMTAEGAVKIRTSDDDTPSPPKERAFALNTSSQRSGGLQRSKSAIGVSDIAFHGSPLIARPRIADGKLGRSRDARTWEFYCDSEARDSLSSHAEHESNGSAVGAINIIRSQSQRQLRQMLAPITSRNNVRAPAPLGSNGQRLKPKLARAKSSLARLQGDDTTTKKKHGSGSQPQVSGSPSGDSDKENWAPGTHSSQSSLRRTHASSSSRPVLGDNQSMLSYASGLDNVVQKSVRRIDGKENRNQVTGCSKAKGSDLDCVQGLLSLSQGAWR